MSNASHSFPEAIVALFLRLREFGIVDPDFMRLVESVPHEQFVPVQYFDQAWKDMHGEQTTARCQNWLLFACHAEQE